MVQRQSDRYTRASVSFVRPLAPDGIKAVEEKPRGLRRIRGLRPIPFHGGRVGRQSYVASRYKDLMQGSVLDVGCDEGEIKKLIPGPYVGVDLFGNPDIRIDLRAGLPFKDCSFDCIVATDVLEHLDEIHFGLDELLRVARKNVIISLPNCWEGYLRRIFLGRSEQKNYGLPPEPTGDRHHWFFNCEEAEDFVFYRAGVNGAKVVSCEQFTRRGDLFSFQVGLFGKVFRYPTTYNVRRLSKVRVLHKSADRIIGSVEGAVKKIGWGWKNPYRYKNAFVCSSWFVLEK